MLEGTKMVASCEHFDQNLRTPSRPKLGLRRVRMAIIPARLIQDSTSNDQRKANLQKKWPIQLHKVMKRSLSQENLNAYTFQKARHIREDRCHWNWSTEWPPWWSESLHWPWVFILAALESTFVVNTSHQSGGNHDWCDENLFKNPSIWICLAKRSSLYVIFCTMKLICFRSIALQGMSLKSRI